MTLRRKAARSSGAALGPGEPDWSGSVLRVPSAPADVVVHLLETRAVARWALDAANCLSPEEVHRAHRVADPRRRELFLVSRVALRHVLARRLECPPTAVPVTHDPASGAPLAVGAAGASPAVAGPDGARGPEPAARTPPVTFYSVARTPGFVALALAHRPVGVDAEAEQSPAQAMALLQILHPEDRARLLRVPGRCRARAVTDAWVRLEAVLKGRGVGLTLDPAEVAVGRRRRARLPGGWRVTGVPAVGRRGVRLAVAWRGGDRPS